MSKPKFGETAKDSPVLRPFISFYGGKWRAARRYPPPKYGAIVEPFAGSAGYALRYPASRVTLVEADPVIAGVWRYLTSATPEMVRALPVEVADTAHLTVSPEERALIGFWLNKGTAAPSRTPSAWMRQGTHDDSFWGPVIRERIASQVEAITHWQIIEGDYASAPDIEATWFIDPPYQTPAGRHYRYSAVDYAALAEWARARHGQVIVCEQEGADWLPFVPFGSLKANEGSRGHKVSIEVIWTNDA